MIGNVDGGIPAKMQKYHHLFYFLKRKTRFYEKSWWKERNIYGRIDKMGGVCPRVFCGMEIQ